MSTIPCKETQAIEMEVSPDGSFPALLPGRWPAVNQAQCCMHLPGSQEDPGIMLGEALSPTVSKAVSESEGRGAEVSLDWGQLYFQSVDENCLCLVFLNRHKIQLKGTS